MNRNLIIAAVVVVVVLGGVGGYFFLNSRNTGTSASDAAKPNVENTKGLEGVDSISDLFSSSGSYECKYQDPQRGNVNAYIKNGAVRMDFVSSGDASTSGSSIVKDQMVYFWNSQTALKMAVPDEEELDETVLPAGTSNPQEIREEIEKYKESCREANVSDSLFNPPSDREFQDYSQMMQGLMQGGSNMPEGQQMQDLMQQYVPQP